MAWMRLHRGQVNFNGTPVPRAWYTQVHYGQPCVQQAGFASDEFPCYSTNEGGPTYPGHPGADPRKIDPLANSLQGGILNTAVYSGCGVANGGAFIVLPVPPDPVPTGAICP